MQKITLLLIFIQLVLSTFIERIEEPAHARTSPEGITIISLNHNMKVDYSNPLNDWSIIEETLKITKGRCEDNSAIVKRDSLFNWQNEFIGRAIATTPNNLLDTWLSSGAPSKPRRYEMVIYNSTYKSNTTLKSIPELRLGTIIKGFNQKVVKSDLTNFMTMCNLITSGLPGTLESR